AARAAAWPGTARGSRASRPAGRSRGWRVPRGRFLQPTTSPPGSCCSLRRRSWRPSLYERLQSRYDRGKPGSSGVHPTNRREVEPRRTRQTPTLWDVEAGERDSGLRLAELVAAFSLATDLGLGQPMEHVLRSWLISARLGDHIGVKPDDRGALYYVATLAWVGCVADTAELATWFGDDIAFRGDSRQVDLA